MGRSGFHLDTWNDSNSDNLTEHDANDAEAGLANGPLPWDLQ